MKNKLRLTIATFIALISLTVANDYLTFVDRSGREIEAKIIKQDPTAEKITVQRKGQRKSVSVPISAFNEATQSLIQNWCRKADFMNEKLLLIECKKIKKKGSDESSSSEDLNGNMSYSKDVNYNYHFKISLENKSTQSFDEVSIESTVYFMQQKFYDNRNKGKPSETKQFERTRYSQIVATVSPKSETDVESETVTLNLTNQLNAELHGIIVRISFYSENGEAVVREIKYPDKLSSAWIAETTNVEVSLE